MRKMAIETIHEKNRIVDNIINALQDRSQFLILGHRNQDEDCIASMVAIGLLVGKFTKKAHLFLSESIHEHFKYLLDICRHNSIGCGRMPDEWGEGTDAIVVCDTPKPSMIDSDAAVERLMAVAGTLVIEIDHHIGGDSEYIGSEGYRLVTEATSSSELVGQIALKIGKRPEILERYNIQNLLSRNLVLAILTGIVGDTNMGQFIKSKRQRRYYDIFVNLYNSLLVRETINETNFMNKEQVFHEIQRLSTVEERCSRYLSDRTRISGPIAYVLLDRNDMKQLSAEFDPDTIVSVSRSMADRLAEESGRLGMVAYDDSDGSGLIQFRLRRSHRFKTFDLRRVLEIFSIQNGGGHEGAIGFRVKPEDAPDLKGFVDRLLHGIEKAIA